MATRKKKIDVGEGYQVVFLQRARGQETPYWVGQVLHDGEVVGSFENGGTGGATLLRPESVVEAFRVLFDQSVAGAMDLPERESVVLYYAEEKGYRRDSSSLSLDEYARAFVRAVRGTA